jgi:glycine hydroxymethyltransferase
MKEAEMKMVGGWIVAALDHADDPAKLASIRSEIAEFAKAFPVPGVT